MNGIVINIDPVIAQIGPFEIRWYSLAILAAVVAAVAITAYRARKKGIAPDETYTLAVWVIAAGIIGARLFHVIDHFGYYSQHPGQILQIQQGGLAIWGALVGGALAAVIYDRVRHIPIGRFFDAVTPALLVAQIIGRFGCIVNGDAYGGLTTLPWGFIYTNPNAMIPPQLFGVPTQPYPVYEMIWNGLSLLIIWRLGRSFKRDGMLFLTYLSLYSLGRFLLTFVRQENTMLWGLQQAQVIALFVLAVSLGTLAYMALRRPAAPGLAELQQE